MAATACPKVALAAIQPGDWLTDSDGRPLLVLHALAAGDFSNYTLTLTGPALDPFFSTTVFSFKAFCPSDFDCAPPPHECPPGRSAAPDRLPGEGLRQFQARARRFLCFSLSRLARTRRSRFRRHVYGGAVGAGRRSKLPAGSHRGRSLARHRDVSCARCRAWRVWSTMIRGPRRWRAPCSSAP